MNYNKPPRNPRLGEPYYVKRDNHGNKLSYIVYERDENNKLIPIEYKYTYDDEYRKIAFYKSNGEFSHYQYDQYGDLIYKINGNINTGITTEHWYSGDKETLRRRIDAETMRVEEYRNNIFTSAYYNPFIRVYSNPLCR